MLNFLTARKNNIKIKVKARENVNKDEKMTCKTNTENS